jgi:hypothetical protein
MAFKSPKSLVVTIQGEELHQQVKLTYPEILRFRILHHHEWPDKTVWGTVIIFPDFKVRSRNLINSSMNMQDHFMDMMKMLTVIPESKKTLIALSNLGLILNNNYLQMVMRLSLINLIVGGIL